MAKKYWAPQQPQQPHQPQQIPSAAPPREAMPDAAVMTETRTPPKPPAGWYPDPDRPGQQRYWDGRHWTQQGGMVQQSPPMMQQSPPAQLEAAAAPVAPIYKRPWFVAVTVVFALFVMAGISGGGADPEVNPLADTDADSRGEGDTAPAAKAAADSEADAAPVPVSVVVPDVVGLNERKATAELEDADLDVSVSREDVQGAKEGEVVGQSPKAGRDADAGSTVTLSVATGVWFVTVPDVTGMKVAAGSDELRAEGFKVDVTRTEDDSVPAGEIVDQSPTDEAEAGDTISLVVAKAPPPQLTSGQENALRSADNYLSFAPFSRKGLIDQLEFEGYSTADATFAVDNVTVNWNEQAAKAAKNYLDMMPFSHQGLIDQLEFEGYTPEQAAYGVNKAM